MHGKNLPAFSIDLSFLLYYDSVRIMREKLMATATLDEKKLKTLMKLPLLKRSMNNGPW